MYMINIYLFYYHYTHVYIDIKNCLIFISRKSYLFSNKINMFNQVALNLIKFPEITQDKYNNYKHSLSQKILKIKHTHSRFYTLQYT